jgi:hypothetical protein
MWEVPRPLPTDDHFEDIYDELEYIEPESVEHAGLSNMARQKRSEAEAKRKSASAAAQATAQAAATGGAAASAAAAAGKK